MTAEVIFVGIPTLFIVVLFLIRYVRSRLIKNAITRALKFANKRGKKWWKIL